MSVPKIGPITFRGTFKSQNTPDWTEAKRSRELLKVKGDMSSFTGKKLKSWVGIALDFNPDTGSITVTRKRTTSAAGHALEDFIANRQSLQKRLFTTRID